MYIHIYISTYICMYLVHMVAPTSPLLHTHVHSYTHTQLNASNTHTHTRTCSAGHDKRHSNKIRNYSQRAAVKSCSRSQKQQQPWHITNTHTYTHTHADTHACKTRAAASPSSLYHNLRERLKSLWGVVKYKNEKKSCSFNSFLAKQRAKKTRAKESERQTDTEAERARVTVLPEF